MIRDADRQELDLARPGTLRQGILKALRHYLDAECRHQEVAHLTSVRQQVTEPVDRAAGELVVKRLALVKPIALDGDHVGVLLDRRNPARC